MSDLVAFVEARLAEDEAVALDCLADYPPDEPFGLEVQHDHQARHDPARVLAGVAAKRRVLALHEPLHTPVIEPPGGEWGCVRCSSTTYEEAEAWPCATLRALASEWAGHSEYNKAWDL